MSIMNKNNIGTAMENTAEISDDLLENISGGTGETSQDAYCPGCGQLAEYCGTEKVKGAMGVVSVFRCNNRNCKYFGKVQYGCDMEWK